MKLVFLYFLFITFKIFVCTDQAKLFLPIVHFAMKICFIPFCPELISCGIYIQNKMDNWQSIYKKLDDQGSSIYPMTFHTKKGDLNKLFFFWIYDFISTSNSIVWVIQNSYFRHLWLQLNFSRSWTLIFITDGYYMCKACQNVYESTKKFKVYWMTDVPDSPHTYKFEYVEFIHGDYRCVISDCKMKKVCKNIGL